MATPRNPSREINTSNIKLFRQIEKSLGLTLEASDKIVVRPSRAALEPLRQVEIDYPESVLCASCGTFHLRPHGSWHFLFDLGRKLTNLGCYLNIGGPKCIENEHTLRLPNANFLNWWLAHLVMRSHRLSYRHGLPLRSLSFKSEGALWASSTEARIVENRLLLRTQSFRSFRADRPCDGLQSLPTCKHLMRSMKLFDTFSSVLSTFAKLAADAKDAVHVLRDCQSCLYRCHWCPSEYRVRLLQAEQCTDWAALKARKMLPKLQKANETMPKWLVLVSWWMDIGECLSADSREWFALTAPGRSIQPWLLKPGAYSLRNLQSVEARFEDTMLFTAEVKVSALW